MARPYLITQYMSASLPCKSEQKRMPFRPHLDEVDALYRAINRHIFDNTLTQPDILVGQMKSYWGRCNWMDAKQRHGGPYKNGTWCQIEIADKWFCPQWFCNVLAHEMVHQWQWDIYRWEHLEKFGREMHLNSGGHGPSFHRWKDTFANWGLHLKIAHGQRRWFRNQNIFKC